MSSLSIKLFLIRGFNLIFLFNDRFFTLVSQNHLEDLLKISLLGFIAEFLTQYVWGGA